MAIHYRVYSNGGSGTIIDTTTPVAVVTTPTYAPTLAWPSDNIFLIRPYDTATGYENLNLDATIRIKVDAAGVDVSGRPAAPFGVTALPVAGGVMVLWMHNRIDRWNPAATGFDIWVTPGASVNYAAAPDAEVEVESFPAHVIQSGSFYATVVGLAHGTLYAIGVRARNAAGRETNTTAVVAFTADVAAPAAGRHGSASGWRSDRAKLLNS